MIIIFSEADWASEMTLNWRQINPRNIKCWKLCKNIWAKCAEFLEKRTKTSQNCLNNAKFYKILQILGSIRRKSAFYANELKKSTSFSRALVLEFGCWRKF